MIKSWHVQSCTQSFLGTPVMSTTCLSGTEETAPGLGAQGYPGRVALWINPFSTSVLVGPSQAKISKKKFSQIFMNSFMQPNFNMENSKIEFIFPNFFIFIFIFASISKKCHKKWIKKFFLRF